MKHKKRIVITGAGGMLGTALCHVLNGRYEVIPLKRVDLDVTDTKTVEQKIPELKPDYIINATGYTAVDNCETDEAAAGQINAAAVIHLAKACKKTGATLIHFSTDYIFDGKSCTGYTENAEPNPLNAYGRSKLLGEQTLQMSGCRYALVRTSWLFGPNGKNFVTSMLDLGKKQPQINVVADQIGCPTYTIDLAEAICRLICSGKTGIFHLTNSVPVSWADFAKTIFWLTGMNDVVITDIEARELNRPAQRPACSTLRNTRRPKLRPWEEALLEYLDHLDLLKFKEKRRLSHEKREDFDYW